ncbi:MAG: tRNA pseudouridine(38-40) synthase TruA [Pyrinomonadaceae bacterium]|nr:tRNA pseudouridine(38-40) synthase TruA [Pyrinomonadaceae bacterium]
MGIKVENSLKMNTWKLEIEYEGTRYRGWQMQKNAKTVQGEIINAAEDIFQQRIELGGAGRTDAGVHAFQQIAHLRIREGKKDYKPQQLLFAFNDRLPHDINILKVIPTSNDFHARHDAVARQYLYQISTRRTAFAKNHVWWVKDKLNLKAMETATNVIVGKHNFRSFCEIEDEKDSTIVVVNSATLMTRGTMIYFRINASHFLWKMVRRLVGTIVEVGRGRFTVPDFESFLETPNDTLAKYTAPPSGLFLEKIFYKQEEN